MAKKEINGVLHYTRRAVHPYYGKYTAYSVRSQVVYEIKCALREAFTDPPRRKMMFSDWLLAEAAMRVGYEAEDVIGLMGGRSYGLR